MKTLLVILLACAPLCVLTVVSGAQLARSAGNSPGMQRNDFKQASELVEQAAQQVQGDLPAARQWAQLNLFDPHPPELAAATSSAAGQAIQAWKRVQATSELTLKVERSLASLGGDESLAGVDQRLQTVEALIQQERDGEMAKAAGAERVFKALDQTVVRLRQEQARLKTQLAIEEALQAVRRQLKSGSAAGDADALRLLAAEPLLSARDSEALDQINTLRTIVQYRQDRRKLSEDAKKLSSQQALFEAYNAFLRRHPSYPSPMEREAHELAVRLRAKYQAEVDFRELTESRTMAAALTLAAAIVKNGDAAEIQPRVRSRLQAWLTSRGLPKFEPPESLLGKDEAVTTFGRRLVGIFYLPDGVEQWRYWENSKSRESGSRGEYFRKSELAQHPGKPKYLELAREYHERREKLLRNLTSKEEWETFAGRCEKLQKELTEYRERWGYSEEADRFCREWTFEPQAQIARECLEAWNQFEACMAGAAPEERPTAP